MNSSRKIITALLLTAVIGIWSYVLWSFLGKSPEKNDATIVMNKTHTPVVTNHFVNKKLLLQYADPFLKSQPTPHVKRSAIAVAKVNPEEEKKSEYQWPEIKYKGLLVNQNNQSKRLAVVVINGKESIIREGEMVADVRVVSFDKSKVQFQHEKESRIFTK